MKSTTPRCGHFIFQSGCKCCRTLKRQWYQKLKKDPDWRDIEYGLENPERLYEPVSTPDIDPLTIDYYDRVLEVFHQWVAEGRSKRDQLVAELLGSQNGNSGTQRGISEELKARGLRPWHRNSVNRTTKEITGLVFKKDQRPLIVEQSVNNVLSLLDSKPPKDEADGQTTKDPARYLTAA